VRNFQFRSAELLPAADLDLLEALDYPKDEPSKVTPEIKFAYETVKSALDAKTLQPGEISEWLVQERASSAELVSATQYTKPTKSSTAGDIDKLFAELNKAKSALGLKPCPATALTRAAIKPLEQRFKLSKK